MIQFVIFPPSTDPRLQKLILASSIPHFHPHHSYCLLPGARGRALYHQHFKLGSPFLEFTQRILSTICTNQDSWSVHLPLARGTVLCGFSFSPFTVWASVTDPEEANSRGTRLHKYHDTRMSTQATTDREAEAQKHKIDVLFFYFAFLTLCGTAEFASVEQKFYLTVPLDDPVSFISIILRSEIMTLGLLENSTF